MDIKKGRWEDWEKDYLFKHYDTSTAKELAAHLGRSETGVIQMKRGLGLKKNKKNVNPEQVNKMLAQHRTLIENTTGEDLDEAQQRRFWYNELMKSPNWNECILMFDDAELALYKNKYVETMMALETVNEIEKGSVHVMISAFIRINRYQKLEKEYRDMAEGDNAEIGAKAISLHNELRHMVEIYVKATDELNASRKQRIKEEGDQRMNLLELLKELDKKENREKLGKEADALKHLQKLENQRLHKDKFIRGE